MDKANDYWKIIDKKGMKLYNIMEVISPKGENKVGEKYMEFYLDEEALDEVILRLFYAPKN